MHRRTLLILAAVAMLGGCNAQTAPIEPVPAPPTDRAAEATRIIGTFKRDEVVTAYYNSTIHASSLVRMRAKLDAAIRAGDTKRAAEIEAEGSEAQDLAHRQLWGDAPLKNILDALGDVLPQVASEAGVEIIVEAGTVRDPSARFVDVTELIVRRLPPATRG